MRKLTSPLLDPLFSPLTQRVLGATLLRPEKEWYLSDLADFLKVWPSSLQKTLGHLTKAEILTRRQDGNRIYFRPNPACPIMDELASILTKTVGLAEPLQQALAPLAKQIRVAFIHGSIAENEEHSDSDVDIIIVGEVEGLDLTQAMYPLQEQLGREVNYTRFSVKEFVSKVKDKNHFLTNVLSKKRIFLIGDEIELEKIISRPSRRS